MNQDAAHSDRLHHTGVTDVMNAKGVSSQPVTIASKT
jgi:hypothetical protein